jgi:hypothetical protein
MTRRLLSMIAAAGLAPFLLGGATLRAPAFTVGRNLQAAGNLLLPERAPEAGLEVTITSEDPARVTFATAPDQPGAARIVLKAPPRAIATPEFWVHGMSDSGEAAYTIAAPGFDAGKGVVKLAPSAIVIVGPFRLASFSTTPRSPGSKLTIVAALLDSSRKVVEEQQIAGGLKFETAISNSSPEAGVVDPAKVTLAGGVSAVGAYFKPAAVGSTVLATAQPAGFTAPAELASVTAVVDKPGLALTDEFTLGKDLQILGVLCLGEAAPEGGLEVTMTSSDPQKLVLSAHEKELGSGVLKLRVPAGALTAQYYLQALADSGSVTYRAVAEGFRHRVAKIGLAPSGFIVAYAKYGPPDEAAVLRDAANGHADERRFYASVAAAGGPVQLAVFSAYLDPKTGMAADITVQPLRAGVSARVSLRSSNPAVGTVESPLEIVAGNNRAMAGFQPVAPGETVISIDTPAGFRRPANATAAPATVTP